MLRNVDLRIAPGETVAFVGETGAGKSTVARLLTRFYDPDSGTVTIDGHDLRDVTIESLAVPARRRPPGAVPVRRCRPRQRRLRPRRRRPTRSSTPRLVAVGIDDLVDRLGGLDAVVHERGASLSAGERQLLALARAFVARPRVLILDEATSNLDLHSESRVEKALDVVLEGRTAVIIAHRLATARRADRIAVVHDGEIVELGSHDELVSHEGRYAAMYADLGRARRRRVSVDTDVVLVAVLVMTIASTVQASVGFGANLLAAPVFAHARPGSGPRTRSSWPPRRSPSPWRSRERDDVDRHVVGWATAGRLPGAIVGAIVLAAATDRAVQLMVAITILVAVALSSAVVRHPRATFHVLRGRSDLGVRGDHRSDRRAASGADAAAPRRSDPALHHGRLLRDRHADHHAGDRRRRTTRAPTSSWSAPP